MLTFWLCHQNIGISLPFHICSFLRRSNWADTAVPGFLVLTELQVTATNLVKQPGRLQSTAEQGDILLPATIPTKEWADKIIVKTIFQFTHFYNT